MGFKTEGVFIKCDNSKIDIDMLVTNIFGPVKRIGSLGHDKSDINNGNITTIDIHKSGVNIINYQYTPKFLNETDYKEIQKLKSLDLNYACILAYAIYDSADSYGFRYIDGNRPNDRLKYQHHNGIVYESGNPLDEEMKYLNGRYYRDEQEDNLVMVEVNSMGKKSTHNYYYMYNLTYEVILEKLGIYSEQYSNDLIESTNYIRDIEKQHTSESRTNKGNMFNQWFRRK